MTARTDVTEAAHKHKLNVIHARTRTAIAEQDGDSKLLAVPMRRAARRERGGKGVMSRAVSSQAQLQQPRALPRTDVRDRSGNQTSSRIKWGHASEACGAQSRELPTAEKRTTPGTPPSTTNAHAPGDDRQSRRLRNCEVEQMVRSGKGTWELHGHQMCHP